MTTTLTRLILTAFRHRQLCHSRRIDFNDDAECEEIGTKLDALLARALNRDMIVRNAKREALSEVAKTVHRELGDWGMPGEDDEDFDWDGAA